MLVAASSAVQGRRARTSLSDGLAAADRGTQVEVHQPSKEGGVLHRAGLIEPQLMADVLDVGLAGEQAGHDAGRIARQQADHHEDDDRHAEQRRDGGHQTARDVVQHQCANGITLAPARRRRRSAAEL